MWNWINVLTGRNRPNSGGAGQAHLTFGQTSIGRTISRTGVVLKKQLWIWPIIAFVVLATIGFFIKSSIQRTMEDNLTNQLVTLRDIEKAMLEKWFEVQESNASSIASEVELRDLVAELLVALKPIGEGDGPPAGQRPLSVIRAALTAELEPGQQAHQFAGYAIFDRDQRIVASNEEGLIGHKQPNYEEFLSRVFDGAPSVSVPFASITLLKDHLGRMRAGLPTMFACVPVRDSNFRVIALLGLRIRPEREFTDIIQHGKFGATGETYAIDKNGTLISNSRFDRELIDLGVIPDTPDTASILNVQMRDPGGNLATGFRPGKRRAELPLTNSAKKAISGDTGYSLGGNRDYRGVPNVAAWTWLPKYEMGLVTKIDYSEAFRPLTILQRVFFSLFALLIVAAIAIFIFTIIVSRLQREAQKSAIEARQLGQYRLEEQIGAGGMGVVYRGHHAMLRRPTAVKMLEPDRVSEASIGRFEREVQITCQLNNPHTVAIYDYGRTPEGVFYYAMEFLDGINLESLVEKYGAQPDGRVIEILKQVCASLYEAHSLGLVHRDIKPANIMLNRRGAEPDVVKVLDFGLVKSLNERSDASSRTLSGTPLYMSPEAIQSPDMIDARSDIYAVGAVGYFLLTGFTVFSARTLNELCQQHIDAVPELPSQRLGKSVPQELEHALLACLEKNRAKRPQTARDLANLLDRITPQQPWTREAAEGWWSRHERKQTAGAGNSPLPQSGGTVASGLDRTIVYDGDNPPPS
ncbi:serine/threonine protein kinase [Anatilimnocola floriformis]|uniref:serine/threonine protein kinase n=1 Tax=Anatilimnocola floriformis TaxID=2948575 RepID=UPI0020C40FFD|nr:serine/threonine protein kinase [Anatilimnocola floriformis]